MDNFNQNNYEKEKILLVLLPFWAPLTPPLGISCLKSFLRKHGYDVKTIDVNIEQGMWEIHWKYMSVLSKFIPEEKTGNFYMVGYDVYMNHLMAHINFVNKGNYINLVKELVLKNFFIDIDDSQVIKLNSIVALFYSELNKYLIGLLEREKPTIFGISVYNTNLAASLFAARLVKEKYPHVKTVMGGGIFADQLSYDSPNFKLLLEKTPYIDKIIVGEGELLFLKFIRGELSETKKVFTLEDIEGTILNINSAELPDFSDFNIEAYPHLATYISRSCPYQCNFCSETVQWGNYRKKKVNKAVDEMVQLNEMYGRQLFFLGDSLINPVVTKLAQEMIKRDLSLYWDSCLRADKTAGNVDNTLLWRRGGFYRARLGIESGSQRVLDLMNKKITINQIKKALTSLAYAGIKTTTYWVLGYPGETESDFQQTLDLVEELSDCIFEADWHPFYYYVSGQVQSEKWREENGVTLLYSQDSTDMLLTQTWILNSEPKREVIYDRLRRFAKHCKDLSVPNPYSLKDIDEADERWVDLHKNAVPPLTELYNAHTYTTENKNVKKLLVTQKKHAQDSSFNF